MAVWSNISAQEKELLKKWYKKFSRQETRKNKINNLLCHLQEVGVKMGGNIDKKI